MLHSGNNTKLSILRCVVIFSCKLLFHQENTMSILIIYHVKVFNGLYFVSGCVTVMSEMKSE